MEKRRIIEARPVKALVAVISFLYRYSKRDAHLQPSSLYKNTMQSVICKGKNKT